MKSSKDKIINNKKKSSKIKPSCVVAFILATISSHHLILNPQIETQSWGIFSSCLSNTPWFLISSGYIKNYSNFQC